MLKPLLLLCWIAAITSADLSVAINGVNIPANSESNQANNGGATIQLPLETVTVGTELPAFFNNEDVPSTVPESNGDTKSINNPTEMPKSVTPLIKEQTSTKPIASTTPTATSTSKPTSTIAIAPTTSVPTTTPASTTTSAPTSAPTTPLPPPSTGKWVVQGNNTYICIVVHMAAQFNINYINANNMTIHKAIDIPINSSATGKCGETEQDLTLWWESQSDSTLTNQDNFTLQFKKNETDKHYSLHSLEISLELEEDSNDKLNKIVTLVHKAPQFNIGLSNSYRCFKEQSMNLTFDGRNETVGHLKISNLQFQAFRTDNTTVFGLAKDCSFDTPDIVPITVGCALAGLVVIVLIAYLVGRRRSQARGYLSIV